MRCRCLGFLSVASAILIAPGCAEPRNGIFTPSAERLAWPAAPESARVEYIGSIEGEWGRRSDRTIGRTLRTAFFGPDATRRFLTPHAVAVHDNGNLVAVADTNAHCVFVFDLAKESYKTVEPGGGTSVGLDTPVGLAWDGDQLFIADAGLAAVVIVRPGSSIEPRTVGGNQLVRPAGITLNPANHLLYVSDSGAHAIVVLTTEGDFIRRFGTRGSSTGELNYPAQIACDSKGNVFVADTLNFRVQRFSAQGDPLGSFGMKGDAGGDFALPKGVAVDRAGNVWVVDAQFENVQGFDGQGRLLLAFGGEGRGAGEFWLPAGAAVDARNRLWVADTYNRRVQVFSIVP